MQPLVMRREVLDRIVALLDALEHDDIMPNGDQDL